MKLNSILTSSTSRNYPAMPLPAIPFKHYDAALNERFSFQVALNADSPCDVSVAIDGPEGWSMRTRYAAAVPVPHHNRVVPTEIGDNDSMQTIPGYVPDLLLDQNELYLNAYETNSFWFTVTPATDVPPGNYTITVKINAKFREDETVTSETTLPLSVRLHDIALQRRKDFDITHWFYADCILTWYKLKTFDDRFWCLFKAYAANIAEHGQNVIYVPLFTPQLDTDKYPSQLLGITVTAEGNYQFDWDFVRKYIKIAKECGIEKFEWSHLFSQWGCYHPVRIYKGHGETEELIFPFEETAATSETYKNFLSILMPKFKSFLEEEQILDKSFFHISDEPWSEEARENYKGARNMMKEIAPWMHFMDALSHLDLAEYVDMPVPIISEALDFYKNNITSWCYYCGGPRGAYLNHLIDTPLPKIAMHGLIFYKWPFKGFLHWGYNYWNKSQTRELIDPFTVLDATAWPKWSYGDPFLVYPGENGPLDSIRWEVFAESMQDYNLLQTLGIDRNGELLSLIKSFDVFPKDASWRLNLRKKLFEMV